MQTASSWNWTQIAIPISNDSNHYVYMCIRMCVCVCAGSSIIWIKLSKSISYDDKSASQKLLIYIE